MEVHFKVRSSVLSFFTFVTKTFERVEKRLLLIISKQCLSYIDVLYFICLRFPSLRWGRDKTALTCRERAAGRKQHNPAYHNILIVRLMYIFISLFDAI